MSKLRIALIFAARDAGDNSFADWLEAQKHVEYSSLQMWAADYGINAFDILARV